MKAQLQRLRAEIGSDRAAFDARAAELAGLDLSHADDGTLARAAVALHHGFGAIEAALARLARTLGEGVPEGPDWHQALLTAMALEVPEVRPAVLSPESLRALRRLLGFRHFFRHAYAVALDADQLASLRAEALALREPLKADLDRLDAFLAQVASTAGRSES